MQLDRKQIYTRFCQLKAEISVLQKELREIAPQVKKMMADAQAKSQSKTVVVKPKEFAPNVIEYKSTTRKKNLTPALVGEYLRKFFESHSPLTENNVDDFLKFLHTSLVSDTVDANRLSFKKLKSDSVPNAQLLPPPIEPDIVRF